jgi:hypothetical protein
MSVMNTVALAAENARDLEADARGGPGEDDLVATGGEAGGDAPTHGAGADDENAHGKSRRESEMVDA